MEDGVKRIPKISSAFGVDKISQEVPYICFEGVKLLFNKALQQDWENVKDRPMGAIELMIGAEVSGYLPLRVEATWWCSNLSLGRGRPWWGPIQGLCPRGCS